MQNLGTYPKHFNPLSPPPVLGNQTLGKFVIRPTPPPVKLLIWQPNIVSFRAANHGDFITEKYVFGDFYPCWWYVGDLGIFQVFHENIGFFLLNVGLSCLALGFHIWSFVYLKMEKIGEYIGKFQLNLGNLGELIFILKWQPCFSVMRSIIIMPMT